MTSTESLVEQLNQWKQRAELAEERIYTICKIVRCEYEHQKTFDDHAEHALAAVLEEIADVLGAPKNEEPLPDDKTCAGCGEFFMKCTCRDLLFKIYLTG